MPSTTRAETTEWLNRHPEILIGRDALQKARISVTDPGNTFDVVNKPLPDVVLMQQFDADTKERLWVVALVADEQAERYYWESKRDEEEGEGKRADDYLFERAPGKITGKR